MRVSHGEKNGYQGEETTRRLSPEASRRGQRDLPRCHSLAKVAI